MAISQGTATLAVTSQERTWRINIETARLADPVVTGYRQVVRTAADGSLIAIDNAPTTTRNLSAVATATLPFTPATAGVITGAEIATLIAAWIDAWRTADIAAAAATPPAP
jgi:hypothetical protein